MKTTNLPATIAAQETRIAELETQVASGRGGPTPAVDPDPEPGTVLCEANKGMP